MIKILLITKYNEKLWKTHLRMNYFQEQLQKWTSRGIFSQNTWLSPQSRQKTKERLLEYLKDLTPSKEAAKTTKPKVPNVEHKTIFKKEVSLTNLKSD